MTRDAFDNEQGETHPHQRAPQTAQPRLEHGSIEHTQRDRENHARPHHADVRRRSFSETDRGASASPRPATVAGCRVPDARNASPGAPDAERLPRRGRNGKPLKQRNPNFITRMVNQWFNRLMGAMSTRTLGGQEEVYEAHRTTRDYVWNTIGIGIWGMIFPFLTIVVTQLVGVEQAGMFSLAFVTATLLMIVANYGARTYQVSDVDELHSFSDYQVNRWITCAVMVGAGLLYCFIRGYDGSMLVISIGVYLYRMVDGLADVYEGRLQQMDKLYLAGISQAFRSLVAFVVFSACLLVTRNVGAASIAMAIAAAGTFVVLTFPLALFETPKSQRASYGSIVTLFKHCFPLFLALFLYALIDNMPKFVMEGVLPYDTQLYFNAMYFPAQGILLTVGFIYKPLLVRMANVWADPAKRKRFDLIIIAIFGVVLVLTGVTAFFVGWIGIPLMSFLYGVDFEQFRGLFYIMLAAGGITAAIDFLYQTITVLRRQKSVTKLYLITFGFSLFVPVLLVNFTGLPGAVIGYLIVMCILLVLLIWEYGRIRMELSRQANAEAAIGEQKGRHQRPSALRDERERRERVKSKWGSHAYKGPAGTAPNRACDDERGREDEDLTHRRA